MPQGECIYDLPWIVQGGTVQPCRDGGLCAVNDDVVR
jgi:hypothetical protein